MIEVTIPLRLYNPLNNGHGHWYTVANRRRQQKGWTMTALRGPCKALPGPDRIKTLRLTITRIGPRRLDTVNAYASVKAVEDAVSAIVGVDDGDPRWKLVVDQEKGPFGVRIRIEWEAG